MSQVVMMADWTQVSGWETQQQKYPKGNTARGTDKHHDKDEQENERWDKVKQPNVCVIAVPEGGKAETYLKKLMPEKIPDLMKQ